MKHLFFPLAVCCVCFLNACIKDKGSIPEELTLSKCDSLNVTYGTSIEPIITANCATSGCHVSGGSGSGVFDNYTNVKAKVDNGSFKNRVITIGNMPPSGTLSQTDKEKIQCWLDAGAPNN